MKEKMQMKEKMRTKDEREDATEREDNKEDKYLESLCNRVFAGFLFFVFFL
jgi:hypothetical protein